jgi:hypothetical protein
MPESVGTSQFTEMLDVQIKNTTFEAGLQTLEKAYDDFLNRLNKKGLSPQKVLDVNSIGQLNTQLSSLVSSFTEARNTIVESLGALSSATVEQLGKLSTAIEGKVRVSTRGATKDLNEMATAAEKVGNRFSKLSEMQAFQLYSQLKGSPEALAGLNWKEQKTFDRLNTRFSTSAARDDSDASKAADAEIKARQKADAAIKAINEKRDLELAKLRGKEAMEEDKKNAAIIASEQKAAAFRTRIEQNRDIELAKLRGVRIAAEQKSSELQTRIEQNRDMELQRIRWKSEADAERQAQSQVRLEQKASAERRRIIQSRDAWEAEQRGKRLAQEMKAQQSLNEFLAMSTSQQRRIALGGGWKGNGSLLDPSWQKEANALKSTLDGVSAAASPIERFFSKMSSRMPEFIAQIIKYSIGFQLVFAAINAIQAVLMAPINALKQGVTYLTAIQDRTADIKEALLENVKYSDNWVENTKKAAEASEIATRKIMEVAAAAAMPPEKIEAGLKALVQGGGLKLMNGNLEQSVELTAKLLSLMRARGISETNQRRAVTEINQLMTGQVKPASVLLQVLGVTTAEWKKIRTEAAKTHDLLGTHINATETVRDRLSAVDDRLANAQNRWKDLTATLEQYKNMLFGAFAEGIFRELLSLLQQIKRLFDENKDQLLEMARLTGESVGNFAKMLSIAGDVKNPLRALALIIGQMALSFESMVASGRYMLRFAGSPAMLVFRTLMNGGIPNKEILKNAAEDLKNNTIETATQFQDIKNRSAQLWTLYGSGKSALSMMDTGVAEIEKQQRLTKAILATAKARKLSNDEIAAYRTQLQNLNTLHKQFAARRDYVAAASGKQSPGILGYLDKPNEGDGVSGRLNLIPEFDKTFKDKVEVVKSEQQRLRQETEESVTEREVSVTQGTKAIVASYGDEYKAIHALVQKQKEELPSLRAQMVARGANAKQLAVFDQKVKEYLVTLSTYDTKANEEMQSGIHSQNQRATKDQQAITSQFIKNRIAAADQVADAEIDSYRRSYEDGFMLESAYLAKQLEVERTHHESNMAMLGLEKDAAGANSVARLQAEAAIAKEQAQWNKQQLDGFTKDILDSGDLGDKFKSFGWFVQTVSGNDTGSVLDAVVTAKEHKGAPSMIVLDTVKGFGTFAAGIEGNHHMSFTKDQIDEAVKKVVERLEEARVAAAEEARLRAVEDARLRAEEEAKASVASSEAAAEIEEDVKAIFESGIKSSHAEEIKKQKAREEGEHHV